MRRTSSVTLIASLACAVLPAAQAQEPAPKPGPELQKLAYFIGTWRAEGEMKASRFGPAGKFTNTNRSEWTAGGFYYINQHEEQNPTGTHGSMGVTGYDSRKKVYIRYSFGRDGSVGRAEGTLRSDDGAAHPVGHSTGHDEGTLTGDTWTWTADYEIDGAVIRTRSVVRPTSGTSYDFSWEIASPGTDWTVIQQGRATKVP